MKFLETLDPVTAFKIGQLYSDKSDIQIPEGFAYAGFRVPEHNEYYLSVPDGSLFSATYPVIDPRIILKMTRNAVGDKSFSVTLENMYGTKTVLVPNGYEYVDFRFPEAGEDYIGVMDQKVWYQRYKWNKDSGPRVIVRKVSE